IHHHDAARDPVVPSLVPPQRFHDVQAPPGTLVGPSPEISDSPRPHPPAGAPPPLTPSPPTRPPPALHAAQPASLTAPPARPPRLRRRRHPLPPPPHRQHARRRRRVRLPRRQRPVDPRPPLPRPALPPLTPCQLQPPHRPALIHDPVVMLLDVPPPRLRVHLR